MSDSSCLTGRISIENTHLLALLQRDALQDCYHSETVQTRLKGKASWLQAIALLILGPGVLNSASGHKS